MAKVASIKDAPVAEPEAPKKKKTKLLLMLVAVAVLIAGGGAAWFFLAPTDAGAEPKQEAKAQAPKPPIFVNLEPFTVNLQMEQAEQYLQVVVVLKIDDVHISDSIKLYMPELRHRILLLLASKKASSISSLEGREQLAAEIRNDTNRVLTAAGGASHGTDTTAGSGVAGAEAEAVAATGTETGAEPKPKLSPVVIEGPVQSVLFTSFIIQ